MRFIAAAFLSCIACVAVPAAVPSTSRTIARNGTHVVTLPAPTNGMAIVAEFVRAGGEDEPPGQPGIAHLTEHVLFGGDRDLVQVQDAGRIRQSGGWRNGFVSESCTTFIEEVPPSELRAALRRYRSRVERFSAAPDRVLSAKETIANELARYDDEWDGIVLAASSFARAKMAYRDVEPRELEAGDVDAFVAAHYRGAPPVVVVAGELSAEDALRAVDEVFGDWPAQSVPRHQVPTGMPPKKIRDHGRLVRRVTGFLVEETAPEDRVIADAALWLMCGGPRSVLAVAASHTGLRRADCGSVELETGTLVWFGATFPGEFRSEDWSVLRNAVARMGDTVAPASTWDGFLALEGSRGAWNALDARARVMMAGSAELLVGNWEARYPYGNPPTRVPQRVREFSARWFTRSWMTLDAVPIEAARSTPGSGDAR